MKKAGCFLLNLETKKIALINRKRLNDFSFPKGHIEKGETLQQCALRETTEETGRDCQLLINKPIGINRYQNREGEIEVYMFLAIDRGQTSKEIAECDKEELVWVDFDKVEKTLTYDNLKEVWQQAKPKIEKFIKNVYITEK